MHELLAPAGSRAALEAAIHAGADAVYLGGGSHNARLAGTNFSDEELGDAVRYCHARYKKAYITLNTLLTDKEIAKMPDFIEHLAQIGVDGVIVQDLGLARQIRQIAPDLPLHASTQMTIHSTRGLIRAKELGFSRVVLAREAFDRDMIRNAPLEIEVFVHGALCMSYSGQCYFSSMLAHRSGNRGRCAQPCRHIYKNGYELSLHDLCLAAHIPSLLELPIASLKIEGRLKSPEYVAGVVSVYRRLLDEKRAATKDELAFLEKLFSRQGFTDGYYKEGGSASMFGYRTEGDKKATASLTVPMPKEKKIPLSLKLCVQHNKPASLELTDKFNSLTVEGETPVLAKTKSLTPQDCEKQLAKLGGTPYIPHISCEIGEGLYLSAAALNALRREGIAALARAQTPKIPVYTHLQVPKTVPYSTVKTYCMFQSEAQIPDDLAVDMIWLPLFAITKNHGTNCGAVLPTVFFDKEEGQVREKLAEVRDLGIRAVLCHTIGQSSLCREMGMVPYGGSGLNILNAYAMESANVAEVTASGEMLLSQLVHMPKPLPVNVIIYGRQTLMTTENCLARNQNRCSSGRSAYSLVDAKGSQFPVLCAYPHRNEILNAHPLYMLDKTDAFRGAGIHAFILRFTMETKEEVCDILQRYRLQLPAPGPFTRGNFLQKKIKTAAK